MSWHHDEDARRRIAEGVRRSWSDPAVRDRHLAGSQRARNARPPTKGALIAAYLAANPDASTAEVVRTLGVSRGRVFEVRRDLRQREEQQ